MSEVIVGLIGVMLIVYLFIVVLRPECKFERLFQKDPSAALARVASSYENRNCGAVPSDSEGGKEKQPVDYGGVCERSDAWRSKPGPPSVHVVP